MYSAQPSNFRVFDFHAPFLQLQVDTFGVVGNFLKKFVFQLKSRPSVMDDRHPLSQLNGALNGCHLTSISGSCIRNWFSVSILEDRLRKKRPNKKRYIRYIGIMIHLTYDVTGYSRVLRSSAVRENSAVLQGSSTSIRKRKRSLVPVSDHRGFLNQLDRCRPIATIN